MANGYWIGQYVCHLRVSCCGGGHEAMTSEVLLLIGAKVKEGWGWEVPQFTAPSMDAFSNREVVFSFTRGKPNQSLLITQ